ncbi:MAG: hypothetical protein N2999_02025 [Proteobacteria bacterium]|nr:hypothetical protein [Pseudomonadota bacterium]
MRYIYFHFAEQFFKSEKCRFLLFVFSAFLVTLLISSGQLFSAVYYIDERGVVHFVDDETLIPEKYRGQKRVIERDDDSVVTPKTDKKDTITKEEKEQPKDKFGNSPSFWRQKYKGLVNEKYKKERELRDLESQRDELNRRYESVRTRAFFVGDSQSVTEAGALEIKIRELENMIKITIQQLDELNKRISVDIYNEVIQAGGRTEWLMLEE